MKTKLIGIALALLLVGTGVVAGIVVDRNWGSSSSKVDKEPHRWRGGQHHDRLLKRFRRRLNLTDEQATKVGKILIESRTKMRGIRKQARADIKQLLTPEQVAKYEKMIERRRQRRMRRQRRGPRGP